jgi:hypothetical protein
LRTAAEDEFFNKNKLDDNISSFWPGKLSFTPNRPVFLVFAWPVCTVMVAILTLVTALCHHQRCKFSVALPRQSMYYNYLMTRHDLSLTSRTFAVANHGDSFFCFA